MPRSILIFWLALTVQSVGAFGPTGHRVVGRIAENHLTGAAREGTRALLGNKSLALVSTWADEIRSDPAWAHASSWHWVTIEDGERYDSSRKNPDGDVIVKLEEFIAKLRDPTTSQRRRATALKWIVHLVGDIHQPLHVGRGADRGGNGIAAEWHGEETNMHRVWDSAMIDSTRLSYTELADFTDVASDEQVRIWQASTVTDWAEESMVHRSAVYSVPDNAYTYSYRHLPLVRERLLKAGIRLAGILNACFPASSR